MSLTKSDYFYDKDFYLNLYKDIVRAGDKYELRAVYEEDENGKLRRTSCHKLNPNQNRDSKNCYCCVHWIKHGEADYECSNCGFRFTSPDPIEAFPYCRCGCKMYFGDWLQ